MEQTAKLSVPPVRQLRVAALKGLLWSGGDQVVRRGIDLLFTVVLARLLFPGDFGLLAMASLVTTFVRVFARIGLGSAIVQRRDIDDEYLSTAFWANLAVGIVFCGLTVALGNVLSAVFREPLLGLIVVFLSLRFIISALSVVYHSLLSRRMDYRSQALVSVQATVVAGLVAVGMAYGRLGVWSLVGQTLGEYVATTVLLYRITGWLPKRQFSWRKFVDLWSFGAPLLVSRLLAYLVRNTDNLLIGRFLGSAALGFYGLGYTIFLIPINDLGLTVNRVMFSALSRLQEDSDRLKRAFLQATRYVTLIALPMMVGISLVAGPFIEVVFGPRWLPTVPVVRILALAGFFQLMMTLGPSGVQAVGRPEMQLRWYIISVLLYLPAFAIGLRWGIVGVAAGYLAATALMTPVQFWFVARVTGVVAWEMWDAIRPGVIGCAVMAAVVAPTAWALDASALPKVVSLGALLALGVLVYGGLTWLLHRQALLEMAQMLRLALPSSGRRPLGSAGET